MRAKSILVYVAVLAALGIAAPASAAPVEQLQCVEQTVGASALDSLGDEMLKGWIAEKQGDFSYPPLDTQFLLDGMESCSERFGWSEFESDNAGYAVIAGVFESKLAVELHSRGVDVGALNAFFAPYSPIEHGSDDSEFEEIISGLRNVQGMNVDDDLLVSLGFMHWAMGYMTKTAKQGFIDGTEPLMKM